MNLNQSVFSQVLSFAPNYQLKQCVQRYQGDKWVQNFSCWDQFLTMVFAQLTNRRSLRDIEITLQVHRQKLYHLGFRSQPKRATLAKANQHRDWRIWRDYAHCLIEIAQPLYAEEDLGLDLESAVYALDSTTIDLCLSLFPWAQFRQTKAAIKLHTLLDLQSSIPVFIEVTAAKVHDLNIVDQLALLPGSYLVMDRGYIDFARLYRLHQGAIYFVIRARDNQRYRRLYSGPTFPGDGILCDQTIVLTGNKTALRFPQQLRRVKYREAASGRQWIFLTNNFIIPPKTVADLYQYRWQIELFFKWIKQHLKIQSFYGTSANATKTQIWIAIASYVLIAIIKKELELPVSLYRILQTISAGIFEHVPILQLFTNDSKRIDQNNFPKQLSLLD